MEWVGLRAFIYFAADKVWRIEVRGSPDVEEKFGRGFEKGLGKRWRMIRSGYGIGDLFGFWRRYWYQQINEFGAFLAPRILLVHC